MAFFLSFLLVDWWLPSVYVQFEVFEQCQKYLNWNGHRFKISDDLLEAKLGATQKLLLEPIRETPRCTQKDIVKTDGKDQGQVSKAINRHV